MGLVRIFLLSLIVLGIYTACSDVKFSKNVDISQYSQGCGRNGDTSVNCEGVEIVEGGKVDILFVDDNSASMSTEQNLLASRFQSFISKLDEKHMNYHIAITTTDISTSKNPARGVNQSGAIQDGKLVPLANGKHFIDSKEGSIAERDDLFKKAIARKETIDCEKFINDWYAAKRSTETDEYNQKYLEACPSNDERGIYAANLALKNNQDQFLRDDADLAIVFLSDEDVRSQLYTVSTEYALDEQDKAGSLVQSLNTLFPHKSFGVHAIITSTESCLAKQNKQMSGIVNGSYGWEYKRAVDAAKAEMLKRGTSQNVVDKMVLGDICGIKRDYTAQLSDIFDQIQGQIKDSIELSCEGATNLAVTLSTQDTSIEYHIEGKTLRFNKKLPVGTNVSYRYSCPI